MGVCLVCLSRDRLDAYRQNTLAWHCRIKQDYNYYHLDPLLGYVYRPLSNVFLGFQQMFPHI